MINRCLDQMTIGTAIHHDNLYIGHDVAFDGNMLAAQRRSRINNPIKVYDAEESKIARLESFNAGGMSFGNVACCIDLAVHREHRALAL